MFKYSLNKYIFDEINGEDCESVLFLNIDDVNDEHITTASVIFFPGSALSGFIRRPLHLPPLKFSFFLLFTPFYLHL